MPIPSYVIRHLKQTLSELYPDGAAAGRVATDAGIDGERVNLRQSPVNVWHEVVEEAVKQNRVFALVQVARSEYKEDSPLGRMLDFVLEALTEWQQRNRPLLLKKT